MKEVFIIHVTEKQLRNFSVDDFKKLLNLKEICRLSGFSVKVNKEIKEQWIETLELLKSDPNYRNELFTGWEDKLELLLDNTRDLNEDLYLYSIKANYDQSELKYHYKIGEGEIPFFLGSINPNEMGNHLIVVDKKIIVKSYSYTKFDNETDLLEFLGKNRVYHWSDKHGENGKGSWPGQSPLLCDRKHAATLVKKALNFPARSKSAWVWDDQSKHYLKFYYEGDNPQNQWHAHHIIGKEIRINEHVPFEIKKFFGHYEWD